MLSFVLWLSTSALVTRRLNLLAYDSWRLAPQNSVNYFIEKISQVRVQVPSAYRGKSKKLGPRRNKEKNVMTKKEKTGD
jgi:hypothetical protein